MEMYRIGGLSPSPPPRSVRTKWKAAKCSLGSGHQLQGGLQNGRSGGGASEVLPLHKGVRGGGGEESFSHNDCMGAQTFFG